VRLRVPLLLAAGLVAVAAGCAGDKNAAAPPTTTTPAATAESLFVGTTGPVNYAVVRETIRQLYVRHPEIRSFVSRDVFYTPETRDKVLTVCRRGGPTVNPRERETSRVFGCAPLIFFFYSFGAQKRVAESTAVARTLYRYAANIEGPYKPRPALTGLLRSWGVR
jgi:hypothetical protein